MMNGASINDIAVYLQRWLGWYHPLEEIVTVLDESMSRFRSIEGLWGYIVEHEKVCICQLKMGLI